MNKSFTLGGLALLGLLASCQSKPNQYTISGTVPAEDTSIADSSYVYLMHGEEAIDSALVQDHKFTFAARPVVDSIADGVVTVPDRYFVPIILEAGKLSVNMEDEFASGSPLNDVVKGFYDAQSKEVQQALDTLTALRDKGASEEQYGHMADSLQTALEKSTEQRGLELLKQHPKDATTSFILSRLLQAQEVSSEQIESYKKLVDPSVLSVPRVQRYLKNLEAMDRTQVGKPFVDFEGKTDDGQSVKLSQYVGNGHYTLVDFWASWCGPCRREIPGLVKTYEQYKDKGLQVVGVAVWDEMSDHLNAVKELGITYPQIFNKTEPTELYGIQGIPQIILFAPDGTIVERDLRDAAIPAAVQKALESNSGKL